MLLAGLARRIEPAEREHGGRALHGMPHAKARYLYALFLVVRKRAKTFLHHEDNSLRLSGDYHAQWRGRYVGIITTYHSLLSGFIKHQPPARLASGHYKEVYVVVR